MGPGRSVLVFGGTGYIGRHLLPALDVEYDRVIVATRGAIHPSSIEVAPSVDKATSSSAELWSFDGTLSGIRSLITRARADTIVNLLATGVKPSDRNALDLAEINGIWPYEMYKSGLDNDCRHFVHIGSMAEYRPPQGTTALSEDDPSTVEGLYGTSKAAATTLLSIAATPDCPVTALRIFGVFGPVEPAHRLTHQLLVSLRRGVALPMSDGAQVRDFIFIADVVSGIMAAIRHRAPADFSVFNIGTGAGVSIREFAERMADLGNFNSTLLNFGAIPRRDTDAPYLVADMRRSQDLLGWTSKWSLDSALKCVLDGSLTGLSREEPHIPKHRDS